MKEISVKWISRPVDTNKTCKTPRMIRTGNKSRICPAIEDKTQS